MFYTIEPLANCMASTSHAFFYLTGIPLFLFGLLCIYWIYNEDLVEHEATFFKIIAAGCLIAGSIIGYCSYFVDYTSHDIIRENTPVTGTLVRFTVEGYVTKEVQGKQTKDVEHRYTYAKYEVDDSFILVRTSPSVSYPKKATFYRNSKHSNCAY